MKNQITMIEAFPEIFSGSEYEKSEEKEMRAREKIKVVISNYVEKHGYAPTYREIMELAGYRSLSTVARLMQELFDEGFLETDFDDLFHLGPRAYRVSGFKMVRIGGAEQ